MQPVAVTFVSVMSVALEATMAAFSVRPLKVVCSIFTVGATASVPSL